MRFDATTVPEIPTAAKTGRSSTVPPQVPQLPATPASKQAVICSFRALNWLGQRCDGNENWDKKKAGPFSWARGGGGANLHRVRVEYRHRSAPNGLRELAKRCSTGSKRRPAGTVWPRPHQLTLLVILDGVATFRLLPGVVCGQTELQRRAWEFLGSPGCAQDRSNDTEFHAGDPSLRLFRVL